MSEIKKHMKGKTLKFCPCCKGIAILDEPEAQIRCIDCGLTMDITKCFSIGGSWKEAVEEAVTKWNTRKPMERIVAKIDEEIAKADRINKVLMDSRDFKGADIQASRMSQAIKDKQIVKEEGGIR